MMGHLTTTASGTEELLDEDLAECSWSWFTCDVNVTGWVGSVPSIVVTSESTSTTMITVPTCWDCWVRYR